MCRTPWLVTRRRTCPICKGDVVRSLSRSYRNRHSSLPHTQSPTSPTSNRRFLDGASREEYLQAQAAESRNDAPSSSRPVDINQPLADQYRDADDVEANWADDPLDSESSNGEEGRRSDLHQDFLALSSGVRDLSQSVRTVIWRGVGAVRDAVTGQRRPSQADIEVDRDR